MGCVKFDTLVKYDTIQRLKIDTAFIGFNEVDTFTYYDSIYKVQTIVKWKEKTIKLKVNSRDTIIKTKNIIKTEYREKIKNKIPVWVWGIIVTLFILCFALFILCLLLGKK